MGLSKLAKDLRYEYNKKYRLAHKDEKKLADIRYWEKKAKEVSKEEAK